MSDKPRPLEANWRAQRVLAVLRRGTASTIELQADHPLIHVARQIWELRNWYGFTITSRRRRSDKVAVYTLDTTPRPTVLLQERVFDVPELVP